MAPRGFFFEFTVQGPPLSYQTENRERLRRWQETVRQAALARWSGSGPAEEPIEIVVTYFHEGLDVLLDNDNMIKPIQDALNGLVYSDDRLITDTHIRKTSIDGTFHVRGVSMVLLEAFSLGSEFLHIMVRAAPPHHRFPG